jgi:hypothetical protein
VFGLFVSAAVISKLGQASSLPGALVGVAFAAPTVLLLWLVKRTFYLKLSPAPSAIGAILYCVLNLGGLAFLYQHNRISTLSVFLLMGLGSLCTSILLLPYLASRLAPSQNAPSLADTWRRHWRYGGWALGANAMMWVPINAFYPLLSRFSGLAEAGELKALMNFAAPMLQACAALHTLMLPYAARVLRERGRAGVSVILRRMTLLCVACAVPYWAVGLSHALLWPLHGGRVSTARCGVGIRGWQRVFRTVHCAAVPGVSQIDFCRGFGFELRRCGTRDSAHPNLWGRGRSMEHRHVRSTGFCGGDRLRPPQSYPHT